MAGKTVKPSGGVARRIKNMIFGPSTRRGGQHSSQNPGEGFGNALADHLLSGDYLKPKGGAKSVKPKK